MNTLSYNKNNNISNQNYNIFYMNTLSYNKSNNIYNTNNNIFNTQDPRQIGSVSGASKRIIIKIIIFIAQIIIFFILILIIIKIIIFQTQIIIFLIWILWVIIKIIIFITQTIILINSRPKNLEPWEKTQETWVLTQDPSEMDLE